MSAPPPPPPHGEAPKTTAGSPPPSAGLGPGNYDIFVIPQRDKGGGFIYLPSLAPNGPSFAAGFACALVLVVVFQSMAPAFRAWWGTYQGMGNMGMTLLVIAVGVGAWAWGKSQNQNSSSGNGPNAHYRSGPGGYGAGANYGGGYANAGPPPPPPPHGNQYAGAPPNSPPPNHGAGNSGPRPQWQERPQPPPQEPETEPDPEPQPRKPDPPPKPKPDPSKGAWEKAREETKKREQERKAKEEEERRKAETARKLKEFREREARERARRDKEERERREKLEQEIPKKEREEEAARKAKEEADRKAKEEADRKAKEEADRKAKEAAEAAEKARKGSSYAYSSVGEKTCMWPNGRPPVSPTTTTASTPPKPPPSASPPPRPSARTVDEDQYSYRPYDNKPKHKPASSVGSETSWAPSATTTRTTPPPSMRGPYTTKDPDKIVIKAVYLFMNQFAKTPASQLVSGFGTVTDGLILRITTEGLFIDDDVRGVPQREWDVKAWTLKLVEVWCPPHCLSSNAAPAPAPATSANHPHANLFQKMANQRARTADRGATKPLTGDEADAYLSEMLRACKSCCNLGLCDTRFKDTNVASPTGQTGEWKNKSLHVLRATIRDQEGKRYMFVLDEEEAWKVAVGVQRLRKGTQVRSLGVSGMSASDARGTLETLGWS
ncbi:hypothetical protein LZ31DRAFT_625750 [Colletotrichum somersetense]|nr:hypothetical protein LZ31DRAFT_625750 [Colletotrichum somersetense]